MRKKASVPGLSPSLFLEEVSDLSRSHNTAENYRSFLEAAYCVLAKQTAPDAQRADALETRYMAVVAKYGEQKNEVMLRMSHLFARLAQHMAEREAAAAKAASGSAVLVVNNGDFLGKVYMESRMGDRRRGQTFTPAHLADFMAMMVLERSDLDGIVAEHRPTTILDPCCGAGVMIISAAEQVRAMGYELERTLLATLVDVDPVCFQMAFVQMTLLGIPAIVIHGDSLRLTEDERAWTTAAVRQAVGFQGATAGWLTAPLACIMASTELAPAAVRAAPDHAPSEPTVETSSEPREKRRRHAARDRTGPPPADVRIQGDLFGDAETP